MKRQVTLCCLVFALIVSCASAMAAKIVGETQTENASGVEIAKQNDQSVQVTYSGQKDKEYVIMAVSEDGVDSSVDKPTKETIGTNQAGVVIYMDQVKGDSNGNVEFTVHPNLESATAGDKYFLFISSNVNNSGMTKIGSFTIDEILNNLGDANGDGKVDGQDVSLCVDNFTKGVALTDTQKNALDVDRNGRLDGQDVSMIVDYFTKGVALSQS